MSMSSCEKCWDNPCECGWEYRDMDKASRIKLAAAVLGVDQPLLKSIMAELIPDVHPMNQGSLTTWPEPGQRVRVTLNASITNGIRTEEVVIFHDKDEWEGEDIWYGGRCITSWEPLNPDE